MRGTKKILAFTTAIIMGMTTFATPYAGAEIGAEETTYYDAGQDWYVPSAGYELESGEDNMQVQREAFFDRLSETSEEMDAEALGAAKQGEVFDLSEEEVAEILEAGPYLVDFNMGSSTTIDYTEYVTGKSGYICGAYGADGVYLGTEGNNYIFMIAGVIGKVPSSKVKLVALSDASSYSYYYVSNGNIYHKITRNLSGTSYIGNLNNGKAPSYLKESVYYYSYDGHYFYTSFTNMIKDYLGDTRENAVNPSTPYYNYYQFLPLRSSTIYTAAELNTNINAKITSTSKMKDLGASFVTDQNTYGVNALLAISVAINESAWGSSSICQNKNNLFGLNAVDATPGSSANYYASVSNCVKDFTETYMSKQYLNPNNWKYNGGYLGNKASGINVMYASDPYWGEKAANYAYYLESGMTKTDSYRYTLGIKNPMSKKVTAPNSVLAIRATASTSGTKLYTAPGLFDVAYIIKGSSNGYYQIQSDPVLNSDRSAIATGTGVYDFSKMYAYVSTSYVSPVSYASTGLVLGADGKWHYYKDGKIDTSFTGLAQNEYGWWRIEKGEVNFNYKGFAKNEYGWWYLEAGKVQFGKTEVLRGVVDGTDAWWNVVKGQVVFTETIAKNSSGWWYIKDGKVDFNANTIAHNDNGWFYIKNGLVDFTYTGVASNKYGTWRVEKGKVNFDFKGFAQNEEGWWYLEEGKVVENLTDIIQGTINKTSGWYYVVKGKADLTANTIAQNKYGWWYLKNGKVDFNYNGLAKNQYGWWHLESGKVNFDFEGFDQNEYGWWYLKEGKVQMDVNDILSGTVNKVNGWWYVVNGKVDLTANTVAKNKYGWWYLKNGKVDFNYTGMAKNSYGWWRIESGKVNFDYEGFGQNDYGWWYLKEGKVQMNVNDIIQGTVNKVTAWWYVANGKVEQTATTVAKNKNGWFYIRDGKVDFTYNGLAENSYGIWKIENGKVNFNYTGFQKSGNDWYYLAEGKVQKDKTDIIQGTVNNINSWWYIKDGKVDFSAVTIAQNKYGWWYVQNGRVDFQYNGLAKNSSGWWYVKESKVDTTFNGIAQNDYGWWYIKDGKVDFTYTGNITYQNKQYRIINGQVQM